MDNKITINEIAKLAGVSKTTISFYLNGKINLQIKRFLIVAILFGMGQLYKYNKPSLEPKR